MKNLIITILVGLLSFIAGVFAWSAAVAYLRNYEKVSLDDLYDAKNIGSEVQQSDHAKEEVKNKIGF